MFEVGRICLKIAGRDANKYCVIVEKIDENHFLIDGQTRRKKVNMKHIEPTKNKIDIKEKADHSLVVEEFSKLGYKIPLKKSKKATERPKKSKVVKEKKPKKETKEDKKLKKDKKETKKSEVKEEKKTETKEKPKLEEVAKEEKTETKKQDKK